MWHLEPRSTMWLFLAMACLIQQAAASEESTTKRYSNSEAFMTVAEIIEHWGYPSEEYETLTDDGYYLTLNRIPFGRQCPENTGDRPVVLLVHGLISEGRAWISNIPTSSLGFFLADAGYDIWILNNRGSTWSQRHQNYPIDQEEFWNFSFHEMAMKDIPAAMNFILQKTQQKDLYFLGHSQGGLLGIMVFSEMPQLAEKVKLMLCLAPPYTMLGSKGLMRFVLMLPEKIITFLWGNKEFRVSSKDAKKGISDFCSDPKKAEYCARHIAVSAGFNNNNINVSRATVILGTYPDYTSTKTILHWSQVAQSEELKYFDYHSKNQDIYNRTEPPFYKIEALTVPTAIWDAEKDIIATTRDISGLLDRISSLVFHKTMPSWNHADFIWGVDAPEVLYPDILDLLQKYK